MATRLHFRADYASGFGVQSYLPEPYSLSLTFQGLQLLCEAPSGQALGIGAASSAFAVDQTRLVLEDVLLETVDECIGIMTFAMRAVELRRVDVVSHSVYFVGNTLNIQEAATIDFEDVQFQADVPGNTKAMLPWFYYRDGTPVVKMRRCRFENWPTFLLMGNWPGHPYLDGARLDFEDVEFIGEYTGSYQPLAWDARSGYEFPRRPDDRFANCVGLDQYVHANHVAGESSFVSGGVMVRVT